MGEKRNGGNSCQMNIVLWRIKFGDEALRARANSGEAPG